MPRSEEGRGYRVPSGQDLLRLCPGHTWLLLSWFSGFFPAPRVGGWGEQGPSERNSSAISKEQGLEEKPGWRTVARGSAVGVRSLTPVQLGQVDSVEPGAWSLGPGAILLPRPSRRGLRQRAGNHLQGQPSHQQLQEPELVCDLPPLA